MPVRAALALTLTVAVGLVAAVPAAQGAAAPGAALAQAGSFGAPELWTRMPFAGSRATLAGDASGDRRSDLIAVNFNPGSSTYVMLSSGSAYGAPQLWTGAPFAGSRATLAGDANGDGRTDLIAVNYDPATNTGSTYVMLSTGASYGFPQLWTSMPFAGSHATLAGDVNGDRRADLVAVNFNPGSSTYVMLSTGSAYGAPQLWTSTPFAGSRATLAGDANGDGRDDLIAVNYDPAVNRGTTFVMRSGGTRFGAPELWTSKPFAGSRATLAGDVNGDRRTDLVAVNFNPGSSTYVMLSAGNAYDAPELWSSKPFAGSRATLAGDATGDAKTDVIAVNYDPATNTGSTFVMPALGGGAPVIVTLDPPTIGKTVNVVPRSGDVYVSLPGTGGTSGRSVPGLKGRRFVALKLARQIPVGSLIDTRKGSVRLTTARNAAGATQSGTFAAGVFQVLQSRRQKAKGLTELRLKGFSFRGCARAGHRSRAPSAAARHSRRTIRRLRGNGRGRWRFGARDASATIRGTVWTTSDRCDGTLIRVRRGKVTVRDFRRKRKLVLRAGKSYLARARR